jgi:Zn-dependent peptidase ImmA (M78 family)
MKNEANTKSTRSFTLAHELVHVWLGQDGVLHLDRMMPAEVDTERYCNRVAAEFLVPACWSCRARRNFGPS